MNPLVRFDFSDLKESKTKEEPKGIIPLALPDPSTLARWQRALSASPRTRAILRDRYGLTNETIREFELGLRVRPTGPWVTIPIRDLFGRLINVRGRYVGKSAKINAEGKYNNWKGHGAPALYPISSLPSGGEPLLVVCGMFDALVAIQAGVPAVTWTGGVNAPWPEEWEDIASHYKVKVVFDRGEEPWADRLAAKLGCRAVHLPTKYPAGTDLADLFTKHGWTAARLLRLLNKEG